MRRDKVSFREAVVRLAPEIATVAARESGEEEPDPSLPTLIEPWMDDREVLAAVVEHYHATLLESPEALGYLERRGLAERELSRARAKRGRALPPPRATIFPAGRPVGDHSAERDVG